MATKKKVVRKKAAKKKTTKKKVVKKRTAKKKPVINNSESLPIVEKGSYVYANGSGKPDNGRPPTAIDLDKVFELAKIGCTQSEIYSVLKVNKETWRTAKKNNPVIQETLVAGREEGNASLRRKQLQVAMQGNPQMLVWLGKNKLKQSDRLVAHTETSTGDTLRKALMGDDDVSDMDDDD